MWYFQITLGTETYVFASCKNKSNTMFVNHWKTDKWRGFKKKNELTRNSAHTDKHY